MKVHEHLTTLVALIALLIQRNTKITDMAPLDDDTAIVTFKDGVQQQVDEKTAMQLTLAENLELWESKPLQPLPVSTRERQIIDKNLLRWQTERAFGIQQQERRQSIN